MAMDPNVMGWDDVLENDGQEFTRLFRHVYRPGGSGCRVVIKFLPGSIFAAGVF